MRTIHEFKVNRETEHEVKKETENGVLVTKEKVTQPVTILFKKPNRAESEQADVVSAVEYSESIRKGILTRPLLEKLYDEKGGFLAENYDDKYGKLLARFFELENESYRLKLKDEKSLEDKEKISELAAEFVTVRDNLQALEASRNSLFQNTAEHRAQTKTVFWLTLFLIYTQENENELPIPFFQSKSKDFEAAFEEKKEDYDKKIEENSEFYNEVIDKATYFVSLWFLGRCRTPEDFQAVEKLMGPIENSEEDTEGTDDAKEQAKEETEKANAS